MPHVSGRQDLDGGAYAVRDVRQHAALKGDGARRVPRLRRRGGRRLRRSFVVYATRLTFRVGSVSSRGVLVRWCRFQGLVGQSIEIVGPLFRSLGQLVGTLLHGHLLACVGSLSGGLPMSH